MDAEIKQKWIEALRSGNYIQGDGMLINHNESKQLGAPICCCLGVLEHICGTPIEEIEEVEFPSYLNNSRCPEEFLLNESSEDISMILSEMNDGNTSKNIEKYSFLEIADYIEKNL